MNKLQMAHDYLLKLMETNPKLNAKYATEFVWEMVDAMQAEADKREVSIEELMKDHVHDYIYGRICACGKVKDAEEEWQPDWSQAPEWAGWFSVSKDGSAQWMKSSGGAPYIGGCGSMFFSMGIFKREPCETFNYQGNWQDSLRKRPQ